MKTIKMKKLLEGFAWEREPGKPLPTLADVTRKHAMNEQDPAAMAQSLGMKAGMDAEGGESAEDGKENIITKKFDAVQLGDSSRFAKVVDVFAKSPSIVHKADFFMFLLNKFGADDDVKKKLKMKL